MWLVYPPMSVLRFFSSPPSVVTSGSFVFFSGIFGRSRVFILSSSCHPVPQLHQVTSGTIALGRGLPPAGYLQLVSLGPASVSIDAFQLSHVHQSIHGGILLGPVLPSTWQWHVLPCVLGEHIGMPVF